MEEAQGSRRTLGTTEVPIHSLSELRQKLLGGWVMEEVSLLFSREAFIQQTVIRELVCPRHHARCGGTTGDMARSLV